MIKSKKDKINFIIYDNDIVIRGEEENKKKGIRIDNFREKSLDINKIIDMNFNDFVNYLDDKKIEYSVVEFL